MRLYRLDNPIQRYAWGSVDGIPEALGLPNPGGGPFAELWMGAHPKAPSKVVVDGEAIGLDELIARDPERSLGARCVRRFGPELPFLFKALSAGTPLSIQAHPSKRKAELGFERENLSGAPVGASERNYRDPNSKPESSVALTRLELLCGFRPIAEIVENIRAFGPSKYDQVCDRLERNPGRVELAVLFYGIVSSERQAKLDLLACVRERIDRLFARGAVPPGREGAFQWILRLMELFPGDIGALTPLILNLLTVEPSESVFIAPGELHAYLSGTCLEIMANSDNVIRGALTNKHIDLPELVSVLSFNPERVVPVIPEPSGDLEESYPILAPDFQISRIALEPGFSWGRSPTGPEILLCALGRVRAATADGGELELERGQSAFVAADAGAYSLSSEGGALVYRASVPEIS
jgi:mannose-6-phosphate isomerase